MDELWRQIMGSWALPILVVGSLVDVFQFIWMGKLAWGKYRSRMEEKIREDLLREMKPKPVVGLGKEEG